MRERRQISKKVQSYIEHHAYMVRGFDMGSMGAS